MSRRPRLRFLTVVALSALPPARVAAQSGSDTARAVTAADAVQAPIPESPAFVYLGQSPATITRPTTLKNLGASLVQGIGSDGRVQQGLAFELTPAYYLTRIRLKDYQTRWDRYALANLQLSLGTVRSSGDSASTDLAVGLRMALLDAGDPLRSRDFTDSVAARIVQANCFPGNAPDGGPPENFDPRANELCMARAIESLAADWSREHWNASALMLALATGMQLEQSRLSQGRWNGLQVWLSGSLGLGRWGSLIAQTTYTDSRRSAADSLHYKALGLGGRLLVGSARFNGFVEGGAEFRWDQGPPVKKDDGQWSLGVEFRVSGDLWLSTGFGGPYQALDEPDRTVVFANLRWGITGKARMTPN